MTGDYRASPYRRHHNGDYDLEEGICSSDGSTDDSTDDEDDASGPFDISRMKRAAVDRLKRWRKEKEKSTKVNKIRAHAQVIRAAVGFQAAGQRQDGFGSPGKLPSISTPVGDFDISQEELSQMGSDHDLSLLQRHGGTRGVADKLKTSLEKGIHGDEIDMLKRKDAFGFNTYPRKKGRSFWRFLCEACQDLSLIILMVAAAASLAFGIKTDGIKEGWCDGGSIALAVIIVIVVTAVGDYQQSLQFQRLNEEKQNIHLEVVRGGRRVEVSIFEIVVGDVVPLKVGGQVPADGILIFGHSLAVDESIYTGESKIVHKDSKAPFLMSGCKVADGYGIMLSSGGSILAGNKWEHKARVFGICYLSKCDEDGVTILSVLLIFYYSNKVISVGMNTEWGLLRATISEDNCEETPLQVRINGVATFVGYLRLAVAVAVLIVLVARFFFSHTYDQDGSAQLKAGKGKIVITVLFAVPEGIPLAITLTLANSMRKMMKDKVLVRRLSACETMGFATTICSDKTGTLTLNQMTVVEAYVCGKKVDPKESLPPKLTALLIEGIAQNTTGNVFMPVGGGDVEVSGSPTEKAILQWGVNLGMNFDLVRSNSSIIHAFPFNSEKKRGGVAVKLPDTEIHIHWKGAAEIVLASCTNYMDENGEVLSMDGKKLSHFKGAIEDMAARSLRCIAIAYRSHQIKDVPSNEEELSHWELPEGELVLLAIVGIKDPCRPGVKDAVQLCENAGVKVRMITGDNLKTARAIALECGILESDTDTTEPNLIEGRAFRALSETQRVEVAEKISVMGNSSPDDKLALVEALRKKGHVVAVTADGTNDASALHEADIGLAMGIQGTEVVKESSDIVILDDNFASVVKVVCWSRSIYANIQKFIQFQLTVKVAALVINVVASVSTGDVPLNAVQLLWVNLIMDTLGALAFATEPPTDDLMFRPPVGRRGPLMTNIMWRNLLIQALYQVTVLLFLNFRGRSVLNLEHDNANHANRVKNTLIFNAFVLCQIFNEVNARKPDEINVFKGVTRNHLFTGIVGLTVVLQVIIIFLVKFTSTVRLSWKLWLVSIAIGFMSWPLGAIGKLIPVPGRPFGELLTKKRTRKEVREIKRSATDMVLSQVYN